MLASAASIRNAVWVGFELWALLLYMVHNGFLTILAWGLILRAHGCFTQQPSFVLTGAEEILAAVIAGRIEHATAGSLVLVPAVKVSHGQNSLQKGYVGIT